MKPRMEDDERELFAAFLRAAKSYAEFGTGGSTVLASSLVDGPVFALDSSSEWLDSVRVACAKCGKASEPVLLHVNIGPISEWGAPLGVTHRHLWPDYAKSMWHIPGAAKADLYLIDGRFRVSCAVEALLRCRSDAVILIHDFAERTRYHIIKEVAREIAFARSLSAFVRRSDFDGSRALEILELKRFEPD